MNYESLLLEEKGDRGGVPRNEFASFGGSRVAVDEVFLQPCRNQPHRIDVFYSPLLSTIGEKKGQGPRF